MGEAADTKIVEALRGMAAVFKLPLPEEIALGDIPGLLKTAELLVKSPADALAFDKFKLLLELWTEIPSETRRAKRAQLVVLIHGIRTHAEWQEEIAAALNAPERLVIPLRYSFFDAVRFWCPCFTRERPIRKLTRELRDAVSAHRDYELVIIAHSFGTYAVSEILKENPDIQPTLLVFCGCIVSESFRWDTLKNIPTIIVNDCGIRDIWPVLAKALTWGYGATGRFGFGAFRVKDRFHDFGHSGFLNSAFARRFWLPLADSGTLESGLTKRPGTSYIVSILSIIHIASLVVFLIVVASVWHFYLRK